MGSERGRVERRRHAGRFERAPTHRQFACAEHDPDSGSCNSAYYTILIFPHPNDYRDKSLARDIQ